jgi:hypothetical protein
MLRYGGITFIVFTCVTGGLYDIVNECTARGPGGRRFNLRAASSHPSSGTLFEGSGILTGCLCWRWFVRNLSCDKLVPVVDMVFPGCLESMASHWVVWLGIVRVRLVFYGPCKLVSCVTVNSSDLLSLIDLLEGYSAVEVKTENIFWVSGCGLLNSYKCEMTLPPPSHPSNPSHSSHPIIIHHPARIKPVEWHRSREKHYTGEIPSPIGRGRADSSLQGIFLN